MLAGRTWRRKYTPNDGDLVGLFDVPVLEDAERYDRLTGYFNANALAGRPRHRGAGPQPRPHAPRRRLHPAAGRGRAIERGAALRERVERHLAVGPGAWHAEPVVIASSHLMRRRDRAQVLLEEAPPWDLVVLDEAHHARRRAAGSAQAR